MRIAVLGAGPIGTCFATVLAETGNDTHVCDIDPERSAALAAGRPPFYESGLAELLERNRRAGRLRFGSDPAAALQRAEVVFVAVDAPAGADGTADTSRVEAACDSAAAHGDGAAPVLAVMTTLPIGCCARLQARLDAAAGGRRIELAYTPVFAQEGRLIDDFFKPDRVLIGTEHQRARAVLADLFAPYLRTNRPLLVMDPISAEVCKLTVNGVLASRVSFVNEVARLCDACGADVMQVRRGVGFDRRLGASFLFPGIGYGGPRFPKDVRDLVAAGRAAGLQMELLATTDAVNRTQPQRVAERLRHGLGGGLDGRRLGLWGLAFKAGTDDVTASPALAVAAELLAAGARVTACDPEAARAARAAAPAGLAIVDDAYAAADGAAALIVAVEWGPYRRPDYQRLAAAMAGRLIIDCKNVLDLDAAAAAGFEVLGIGRSGRAASGS